MDCRGEHLMLTIKVGKFDLEDYEKLRELLRQAIVTSGATPLNFVDHKFTPQGYSIVVLIAESHASIHTWPEANSLMVDYFTCGNIKTDLFKKHILEGLGNDAVVLEDRLWIREGKSI